MWGDRKDRAKSRRQEAWPRVRGATGYLAEPDRASGSKQGGVRSLKTSFAASGITQ